MDSFDFLRHYGRAIPNGESDFRLAGMVAGTSGREGLRQRYSSADAGQSARILRVSGKAYWYGHFSEHFSEVSGEAVPQDGHLHVVEVNAKDEADGCVIDLTLITASGAPTIQADDNQKCGGMNVTFRGVWHRFTPAGKGAH